MSELLTNGDFRAYTLKPHWAHAIAHLGKRCENRTRPIPRGLVGKRVAIHAGAVSGLPRDWRYEILSANGPTAPFEPGCSAFVATAVLAEHTERFPGELGNGPLPEWMAWGDDNAASWWRLTDVRTLRCPVPVARGAQGPWRLTQEQVDAINEQGGELRVSRA